MKLEHIVLSSDFDGSKSIHTIRVSYPSKLVPRRKVRRVSQPKGRFTLHFLDPIIFLVLFLIIVSGIVDSRH